MQSNSKDHREFASSLLRRGFLVLYSLLILNLPVACHGSSERALRPRCPQQPVFAGSRPPLAETRAVLSMDRRRLTTLQQSMGAAPNDILRAQVRRPHKSAPRLEEQRDPSHDKRGSAPI